MKPYPMNTFIKENQGKHFCKCKCGCGKEIIITKDHYYHKKIPIYRVGHFPFEIRSSFVKGKHWTLSLDAPQRRKGNKSPHWKGGKPKCIVCGIRLKSKNSKKFPSRRYCLKCFKIMRLQNTILHPRYRGNFCKFCKQPRYKKDKPFCEKHWKAYKSLRDYRNYKNLKIIPLTDELIEMWSLKMRNEEVRKNAIKE